MHRQSQEEVAAAARRRLELLGRELDQAGLRRVEDLDEDADPAGEAPLAGPATLAPVGKHLRPPRPGVGQRLGGWLGDQVPETLRGRVGLDAGPVLLVVALVALAVTATAFVVLRMGGNAEAVPSRSPITTRSGAPSPLVALATPRAGASGAAAGTVTVDIAGKVRRPGVATLPAGSRVVDALHRAGGARGRVNLTSLNLARVLVDGEQILGGPAQPGGQAASASSAAPDASGPLVNINTATAEQLDGLPGVGPVTAQKILAGRQAH